MQSLRAPFEAQPASGGRKARGRPKSEVNKKRRHSGPMVVSAGVIAAASTDATDAGDSSQQASLDDLERERAERVARRTAAFAQFRQERGLSDDRVGAAALWLPLALHASAHRVSEYGRQRVYSQVGSMPAADSPGDDVTPRTSAVVPAARAAAVADLHTLLVMELLAPAEDAAKAVAAVSVAPPRPRVPVRSLSSSK